MTQKSEYKDILIYSALIILVLFSLWVRFIPHTKEHGLTFDEVVYIKLGQLLSQDITDYTIASDYKEFVDGDYSHLPEYVTDPLFKHPPLYSITIALLYKITDSNYSPAFATLLFSTLTIIIVFLLGKILYNEKIGLLAAFFLAIDPNHWICSQKIWPATTLTFFSVASLYFFAMAMKEKEKKYLLLSMIMCGLASNVKYTGMLIIPAVVSYALICPNVLTRRRILWSSLSIPFVMLIPWFIWNLKVYGFDIISKNIKAHNHSTLSLNIPYLLTLLVLALIIIALLIILLRKKNLLNIMGEKNRMRFNLIFWSAITAVLVILLKNNIANSLYFYHLPETGWTKQMFANEPWHFYLGRSLELSPFYIFFIFSLMLIPLRKYADTLLIIYCFWMFLFFILWRNFQCRYILQAVPVLPILASRTFFLADEKLKTKLPAKISSVSRIVLVMFLGYIIFKTIILNLNMTVYNDMAYF